MVTECPKCEHRHPISEKRPPWRWICLKFPRFPWSELIREDGTWEPGFDPYMPCQGINGGACPLFEAKNGNGSS